VQRAELLNHEKSQDDNRPAGVQEILPPLPQAHAAQRSEMNWVIEKFCNWVIEKPLARADFQIPQLLNHTITQ
jgi:hypothetical protein